MGRKCRSSRTIVRSSSTFICDAASVTDQRPFTPLPSQTGPHPMVEASVVTTTRRDTMPIVPDAARNQAVLQIARAFLHLEDTTTLRCLSVTVLSLIDRYHIWNGRIRKIPSGSAMAADAIIPNRHWQHSDETDCPSRNWRTHVLIAFIRSRDSLTSMEVESRIMPRKCVVCLGHRTLFSLFITWGQSIQVSHH